MLKGLSKREIDKQMNDPDSILNKIVEKRILKKNMKKKRVNERRLFEEE
jgi:hypothetical protein